jgi:hypothetical protein
MCLGLLTNELVMLTRNRQAYTPLNEFRCATCSGALSIHEKQALGVILTASAITVMSFAWFANGFGVFS